MSCIPALEPELHTHLGACRILSLQYVLWTKKTFSTRIKITFSHPTDLSGRTLSAIHLRWGLRNPWDSWLHCVGPGQLNSKYDVHRHELSGAWVQILLVRVSSMNRKSPWCFLNSLNNHRNFYLASTLHWVRLQILFQCPLSGDTCIPVFLFPSPCYCSWAQCFSISLSLIYYYISTH